METENELQTIQPELDAVTKEEIQICKMPVSIYLGECENLHVRATLDLALLEKINFDPQLLDRLKLLTEATRIAEAGWQELKSERDLAQDEWKSQAPAMYALHNELCDTFTFAYRNNATLLAHVTAIKEGNGHADAIQDLSRLAVFGRENPEPLVAMNFDMEHLNEADTMARNMADVLGRANGFMYGDNELKLTRDKAYTLLNEVVKAIRDYGRFVFRDDPKHVKSYSSKYERDRRASYRSKQADN